MRRFMMAGLLMIGACGDDGGGTKVGPNTAAQRTPDNAASLKTAVSDAAVGLGALGQIYGDLQTLVLDKQTRDLQSRTGALAHTRGALDMGCIQQTAGSVTYTDCVEGPATFNGSANVNGDRVTFDVTVDIDPDAYNGPIQQAGQAGGPKMTLDEVGVRETGDLTITATTLTGTIDATITLDMTIEIPGLGPTAAPQTTQMRATFDLQRDAAGCAVGGTLVVTSGQTTATAEYGPACGQVTLR